MTVNKVVGDGTRGVAKLCRSKLLISGVGQDGDLQNTKIGEHISLKSGHNRLRKGR